MPEPQHPDRKPIGTCEICEELGEVRLAYHNRNWVDAKGKRRTNRMCRIHATQVSRYGDPYYSGRIDEETKREAVRLYKTGLSLREVADQLGISHASVRKIVNDAGAIRPRGKKRT